MCYVERLGVPSSTRPTSLVKLAKTGVFTRRCSTSFSKQKTAARCFSGCWFGGDNGRSSAVVDWAAWRRRITTQVTIELDVFGHDWQMCHRAAEGDSAG